ETLRRTYGLDQSPLKQYWDFVSGFFTGDLGQSYVQNVPVMDLVLGRLPWTLVLAGSAFVLTVLIGLPLGVAAALRRDGVLDRGLKTFGIASSALFVPSVAILLMVVFASNLGWFPIGSTQDPDLEGIAWVGGVAMRLVLPVATLVLIHIGPYA